MGVSGVHGVKSPAQILLCPHPTRQLLLVMTQRVGGLLQGRQPTAEQQGV